MKQKIFYLLISACILSVISSAKRAPLNCCKRFYSFSKEAVHKNSLPFSSKKELGFELSPLQLTFFN